MAASRQKRSENAETRRELNRKSLRGASLFALRRLELLEGSREAAVGRLLHEFRRQPNHPLAGESSESVDRWFGRRGVPKKVLGDPVTLAFLFTDLSAITARHDRDENSRERRRKVLAHTGLLSESELEPRHDREVLRVPARLDEIRALERLKAMGERLLAEEKEYRQRPRSLAAAVAEELRVPLRSVRRWLSEGRISGAGYRLFRQHERQVKATRAQEKTDRKVFQELMTAGRKPLTITKKRKRYFDSKKAKWITPKPRVVEAPQVPVFRPSEDYYGGDLTSGFRWSIPIREYLSPALLPKLVHEARSIDYSKFRERMRRQRNLDTWSVFVVVSVLYKKEGERGHPIEARSGSRYRYGGNTRDDLELKFPKVGSRFVVKDAYTSGNWPTREAAIAEFESVMWKEIQAGDLTWIHGLVVWNYRRRPAEEWAEIVEARRVESKQRYNRNKRLKEEAAKKKTRKRLTERGRAERERYERTLKKKKRS